MQRYAPACGYAVVAIVYVADVAPAMSAPSFCHWYRTSEPLATQVKLALLPSLTVTSLGLVVIAGGIRFTTKVADALVTVPPPVCGGTPLRATQRNVPTSP